MLVLQTNALPLGDGTEGLSSSTRQVPPEPFRREPRPKPTCRALPVGLAVTRSFVQLQYGCCMDRRSDRQERVLGRLAVRPKGRPFIVQDPRVFSERLRIVARACTIVARAHAVGVVHRDLRPTMIVVDELGDWT